MSVSQKQVPAAAWAGVGSCSHWGSADTTLWPGVPPEPSWDGSSSLPSSELYHCLPLAESVGKGVWEISLVGFHSWPQRRV